MRRKLLLIMSLAGLFPLMSFADTIKETNGIYYSLSEDGTATIVRQSTYDNYPNGAVTIPATVTSEDGESCTVVAIANKAFYGCTNLESISAVGTYTLVIPEGFFTYRSEALDATWTITTENAGAHASVFESTTGITGVSASTTGGAEAYNLAGQKVDTPVSGTVNIVRKADGTVRKELVK